MDQQLSQSHLAQRGTRAGAWSEAVQMTISTESTEWRKSHMTRALNFQPCIKQIFNQPVLSLSGHCFLKTQRSFELRTFIYYLLPVYLTTPPILRTSNNWMLTELLAHTKYDAGGGRCCQIWGNSLKLCARTNKATGYAISQWSMPCATRQKVAGPIIDGIIRDFSLT